VIRSGTFLRDFHLQGKTFTNYHLVESVRSRTGRGNGPSVRSVTWGLNRERRGSSARKLEHAIAGQQDLLERRSSPEFDAVLEKPRRAANAMHRGRRQRIPPPSIRTRSRPSAIARSGRWHIGHQFWLRLGLDEILKQHGLAKMTRQLACAMTLNRLIYPTSEHAMPAWIRRTALDDLLGQNFDGLAEDSLYRVMDALHPHRASMEAALVARERSLLNLDSTIYLYDLTSTYFEGLAAANPKAQRGHTRDGRPDCKQVVSGLVVRREGFPICHEVVAGNTQGGVTLATMLERLSSRAGLAASATAVIDRGLASADNIDLLYRGDPTAVTD
jgi:hypothetical protein